MLQGWLRKTKASGKPRSTMQHHNSAGCWQRACQAEEKSASKV
jgi:hypothetical protein